MFDKEDGKKVWAAFKEMNVYLDKSFQVLTEADEENFYYNDKNQKMYDGVSTLLNSNIGHKNAEMVESIQKQYLKLDNTTLFSATNDVSIVCSKKLCELTDNHYFSCFYTNSGSEACDTAMKIVRKYNYLQGKKKCGIVSLKGAYHGSNMTAMKLCQTQYENEKYFNDCEGYYQINTPSKETFPSVTSEEQRIDLCIDEYKKIIKQEEIGSIFIELIQLSNAVNILPVRYVQEIVRISRENGVVVVIDEVATGFGRTGKMFASEHYGVWGDIMMFAKGVTSGYFPLGGVLVTREMYESFTGEETRALDHGFTTGGHPVACAAAVKNIEIMEKQNVVANAEKMGEYLLLELKKAIGDSFIVKEIRGKGLMIAIVFENYKVIGMQQFGISNIVTRFLSNNGLLLYPDDDETLILAPVLNISREKCDYIVQRIAEGIKKTEKCVSRR